MFVIIVLSSYTLANCAYIKSKLLIKQNYELDEYNNVLSTY
jgi:hypothetical protein